MPTKIQLKRRSNPETSQDMTELSAGEPFFDMKKGHLYIGDDDENIPMKHIAQVTQDNTVEGTGKIEFHIGKDEENKFVYDTRLKWKSLEETNE